MSELDLAGRLEDLFRETGEAHHQAYIETDGADPGGRCGMPGTSRRGSALLEASFTRSELVYLLIWVANEQPLNALARTGRYYADFFLQRYAV